MSYNIKRNGELKKISGNGLSKVDNELSTTSENPVQNKIITEKVNTVEEEVNTLSEHLTSKN